MEAPGSLGGNDLSLPPDTPHSANLRGRLNFHSRNLGKMISIFDIVLLKNMAQHAPKRKWPNVPTSRWEKNHHSFTSKTFIKIFLSLKHLPKVMVLGKGLGKNLGSPKFQPLLIELHVPIQSYIDCIWFHDSFPMMI